MTLRRIAPVGIIVALSTAIPALANTAPTTKHASAPERTLASYKCQEDRFDDPAEFRFTHGRGAGALERCIRFEIRKARFECLHEQRTDRFDYRRDYGTGRAALARCVRDELD
jgi:hypothetical protein